MKKLTVLLVLTLVLIFPITASAESGTQVFRFSDEPFNLTQCYSTTDFFPGPAETFDENVCVQYLALNSETVRVKKNGDVEWSLVQHGTATVYAVDDNEVLYEGTFQVEEVGRDDGGDASCLASDGHAWLGKCTGFFTNLDFLQYNWKIAGNSVYSFNATIRGAGNWCYSSKQGGSVGPGCK